jgi:hypothetical protein
MMWCMRTTITLDERLLREAKRLAARRRTTLSAVIAEALRVQLSGPRPHSAPPFELVTFRGSGPHHGIDLDRTGALEELEDRHRHARTSGREDR